jgi:hypothetical protein
VGDWVAWHDDYGDPESSLSRRLGVVQRNLRAALDLAGPGARVLSLCAGDGRDLLGVLAERDGTAARALLVELDPMLAERARAMAPDGVQVREGDAGAWSTFADALPVDVLLLCGIFGNVDPASVRAIVDATPAMVVTGGTVIWTRGQSEPDHRPEIREWFVQAGFEELAFDGPPERYGVGFNRNTNDALAMYPRVDTRLFTFTR